MTHKRLTLLLCLFLLLGATVACQNATSSDAPMDLSR